MADPLRLAAVIFGVPTVIFGTLWIVEQLLWGWGRNESDHTERP